MCCGYTRARANIYTQAPSFSILANHGKASGTAIVALGYFHGLNIFIVLDTCVRQNGHRDTELEHLLQRTWPHGIRVMLTSAFRQTRHDHAALATSASLTADSAFSYSSSSTTFQCHGQSYQQVLRIQKSGSIMLITRQLTICYAGAIMK